MAENVFCTACGTKIEGGQKFCTSCGKPVEAKAEPTPAPTPVQEIMAI